MNRQENVKKFEELLSQVDREGMPQLLEYIRDKSDFYTAPASTRFHLSTEGGLLQHSLNVYECLQRKAQADTVLQADRSDIPRLYKRALSGRISLRRFYGRQIRMEAGKAAAIQKPDTDLREAGLMELGTSIHKTRQCGKNRRISKRGGKV